MDLEKTVYLSVIAVLLFICGFLYTNEGNFSNSSNLHKDAIVDLSGGIYLRFVFIGSSACSFSNNDDLHAKVKYIKESMSKVARYYSLNFLSTGISNDMISDQGVNYLSKTGPYSEIIAGAGAYNLGVIQYTPGVTVTPQIVITVEDHQMNVLGLNTINFNDNQQTISTHRGSEEIKELYNFVRTSSISKIYEHLRL